jgi:hypothetical protein
MQCIHLFIPASMYFFPYDFLHRSKDLRRAEKRIYVNTHVTPNNWITISITKITLDSTSGGGGPINTLPVL